MNYENEFDIGFVQIDFDISCILHFFQGQNQVKLLAKVKFWFCEKFLGSNRVNFVRLPASFD